MKRNELIKALKEQAATGDDHPSTQDLLLEAAAKLESGIMNGEEMGSVAFWLKVAPPVPDRLSSALRAAAKGYPNNNTNLGKLLIEAAGEREQTLNTAREVASYKAWLEFMEMFTQEQRQHVAMVLAHDWKIVQLGLRCPHIDEVTTITGERE